MRSSASLRPVDAGVGVGVHLRDGGFRLCPQPVDKPVGLEFELVDPMLGLAHLSRELVRQRQGTVAILVRQVRRLLQISHEGRIGVLAAELGAPTGRTDARS